MKNWVLDYQRLIKRQSNTSTYLSEGELSYWQDQLFLNFLVYCLPFSFIAVIPCVYMAIREKYLTIAIVDILAFLILCVITFCYTITLKARKLVIVGLFYLLAFFLINAFGFMGPGALYLFAITGLIALILPSSYAYWSVAANTAILLTFAVIINYKLFGSLLIKEYSVGGWLAFGSNLVFLSLVIVLLIHRVLDGLELTINRKGQLQEKYRNIFEKSPLPMWLFDTESLKFLDVNQAAIRHYGYSRADFLNMSIQDIRPAEDIAQVEDLVKSNRSTGVFYEGVSTHIKKNGDLIKVKVESNLLDFGGHLARLVLATDITVSLDNAKAVQKANQKIKESEADLRTIFESTIDGFILLDSAFMIKAFNQRAIEYINFNSDLAEFKVGASIFDYVEQAAQKYFPNLIKRVMEGEIIQYDRKYSQKNALSHWIHYTLMPVFEEDHICGVCITGRDITIRKNYIKTIEDQNKTFREISWMQSHLVRAPLARIMGLTTLLISCPEEDERLEMLKFLEISASELDEIIKQINDKSNGIVQKYKTELH